MQVSIVKCASYEEDEASCAVNRSVELIGGISKFVKPGQKVLIKPNMLGSHAPEKGVTTHPSALKAVVKLVQSAGGHPFVGDSPGFDSEQKAFEVCGYKKVCEETGAEFSDFKDLTELKVPFGRRFKAFTVAKAVTEADVIINLPKLKTHALTGITAATKNMFGCIPGLLKSEWHVKLPDRDAFAVMLLDLFLGLKPAISIVDAVFALEGEGGPAFGPLRNVGLIAASADAQALDHTLCRILDIDPQSIPTISNDKLFYPNNIELLGEKIEELKCSGFKKIPVIRATTFPGPAFIQKVLNSLVSEKPVLVKRKCIHCQICKRVCLSKAISFPKDIPVFDYNKCIRCFCCAEMCPAKAIEVRRGWPGKLLLKLSR
ncbi:MAG: DUF362 domain-containing protein [Candidatus Margulisiibacteriota bacterium]